MTLVAKFNGVEQRILCGHGTWQKGPAWRYWRSLPARPVAVSGAWTADDAFTAKICFYETPFVIKFKLKFTADQLFFESESNVSMVPTTPVQLVGKAE